MRDSDISVEKIFERLRPLLAPQCRIEPNKIFMNSRLDEDLSIDSLDWVEIVYEIEEEFGLENLDDYFNDNFDNFRTMEQLALKIEKLLKQCLYCHNFVEVEQAIQINNYYKKRLAYIHQECETPTRQLEREMLQKQRERKQKELDEELEVRKAERMYQEHRQAERSQKKKYKNAFKVVLGGTTLYAILLYTLGFNYFILIFIILLSLCASVIFI